MLKNHSFDFSIPKDCPLSIDNTFVLVGKVVATLYSENTKIKMTVNTNQPKVHIYVVGNCFGHIKGKEIADYNSISSIYFETQNFPDAHNHCHFPSAILIKGEEYFHETTFKFQNL
jgi:aldose 1-epimerase